MDRKEFIQTACLACMGTMTFSSLFISCNNAKIVQTKIIDNKISVLLSELNEENKFQLILRPEGYKFDILLVKIEGQYNALLLKCTHVPNPIYVSDSQINCNEHGSTFDLNGTVLNGPASKNLKKYITKVNGDNIDIYLI